MYTLGLHVGYMHDSSATLLKDGSIIASVAEERVSRIKKDKSMPYGAISRVLSLGRINPGDVDRIFVGAHDVQFQAYPRKFFEEGRGTLFTGLGEGGRFEKHLHRSLFLFNRLTGIKPFGKVLRIHLEKLGILPSTPIDFLDHHDCHMASVFFTASKLAQEKDALIFCVDGYGEGNSCAVYQYHRGQLAPERIASVDSRFSPGRMYSAATSFLGMTPNRHEGKVLGLSAHGSPEKFFPRTIKYLYFDSSVGGFVSSLCPKGLRRILDKLTGRTYQTAFARDFGKAAKEDLAAAVQARLEAEVLKFLDHYVARHESKILFCAGGVFSNVKLNMLIAERYPSHEVQIHPGMTDEGVSLGAAILGSVSVSRINRPECFDAYLGTSFNHALESNNGNEPDDRWKDLQVTHQTPSDIASAVAKGKIVGLIQGRMEYGPRALGNRSILVDPRGKEVNDTVNRRLSRTEFMPFAPVVLAEYADNVFHIPRNLLQPLRYMAATVRVRGEWQAKIPAVVHVDGTARPQILERSVNPFYYDVLEGFFALTGIPVLINTSFNLHEEPIVETLDHAITALRSGGVDLVYSPDVGRVWEV